MRLCLFDCVRASSIELGPLGALLSASIHLAALSGCEHRGSSGPLLSGSEVNGVASNVTSSDLGGGRVEVQFTLRAPIPKELGADVEYSHDRGLSYSAATLEAEAPEPAALPAHPDGVLHTVVWRVGADLEDLSQHDLRMRITPYDQWTGARGIYALSSVFGIGANAAPRVSAVSAPTGPLGGWITLQYTVVDNDGDHVEIEGEYSLDGGLTYQRATLSSEDGTGAIPAPPGGATHSIAWHAQGDAPGVVRPAARVRLWAVDISPGPFTASGPFAVDTRAPTIELVTLEAIPGEMNGSVSFTNSQSQSQEFTLLSPEQSFAIWIRFLPGGPEIDRHGLEVTAEEPLGGGTAAGGLDAGTSFGHRFAVDLSAGLAICMVSPDLAFPFGFQSITARIRDVIGNTSSPVRYTFQTGPATPLRRPFESPDRWLLDFTRDQFAISSEIDSRGMVTVTASPGGNGISDFVEDLRILGLQSASPPPPAVEARLNELVLAAVKDSVLGNASWLYGRNYDGSPAAGSAGVEFSLVAPAAPHSRIGIGGDDPLPGYTLGRAVFDYKNSFPYDELDLDQGVFTTNLIDFYINSSYTFRTRFNPLVPGRGTPLGFHPDDVTVLGPGFDRQNPLNTISQNRRYDDLAAAIDAVARVTAVILAHEIGHAVGLVANGAPPLGLFGGEYNASFARTYTNPYHLDTGRNDIMAASLGFSSAIATGAGAPHFSEMCMAYLRERILLD